MAKMQAPKNGIAVRMYRQGHGDCFLLAMPRKGGGDPVYVLIDCGYKGGSQKLVHGKAIGETVKHIGEATGKRLDLVIITHEHEDHVNGFGTLTNSRFADFTIKKAWFAWTEDPGDAVAEQLREQYRDRLFLLVEARRRLALAFGDDDPSVARLDSLLSLEFGLDSATEGAENNDSPSATLTSTLLHAYAAGEKIPDNKEAMKIIKDKAEQENGISYLKPQNAPKKIPGSENVRAFVLGPPRNPELLKLLDPKEGETFFGSQGGAHLAAQALSFAGALRPIDGEPIALFDKRFHVSIDDAASYPTLAAHYGAADDPPVTTRDRHSADNAAWRRINNEWLFSAETLALDMNDYTNNTSLVLAFELPLSKKTLLFAGDAQRGNWLSWDDYRWKVGGIEVTARDLLARTVLYKVGHHGSHNATLNGQVDDAYPNLAWMAVDGAGMGAAAGEFTAMITAVKEWAEAQFHPWYHPWTPIKNALMHKARGRVFQTDTPTLEKPDSMIGEVSESEWQRFLARATFDEMYFELQILDEPDDESDEDDD